MSGERRAWRWAHAELSTAKKPRKKPRNETRVADEARRAPSQERSYATVLAALVELLLPTGDREAGAEPRTSCPRSRAGSSVTHQRVGALHMSVIRRTAYQAAFRMTFSQPSVFSANILKPSAAWESGS